MKIIFSIVFFILIFNGCENYNHESSIEIYDSSETQPEINLNKEKIITIGDHSYVPINLWGTPDEHAETILNIIKQFENIHQELEVTDWKVEKEQGAWGASNLIFGIWIDHKPRK